MFIIFKMGLEQSQQMSRQYCYKPYLLRLRNKEYLCEAFTVYHQIYQLLDKHSLI